MGTNLIVAQRGTEPLTNLIEFNEVTRITQIWDVSQNFETRWSWRKYKGCMMEYDEVANGCQQCSPKPQGEGSAG